METIPLSYQIAILSALLLISAFFSIAETSLMSANRHRLRHLGHEGSRGARLALNLLAKTDKLLGVILLGNTLCIAASTTISTVVCVNLFGEGDFTLAIATLTISFLILVFGEISPKVIGAANPEKWAIITSFLLYPLLQLFYPAVWCVNLLVSAFLRMFSVKPNFEEASKAISLEELKSIVTDAGQYIPKKNRTILLNLFELEKISVDDVMTAHTLVEFINFDASIDDILQQISSSHHTRMPVRQGDAEEIVGIMHLRKMMNLLRLHQHDQPVTKDELRDIMSAPYFVPSGTPLYTQMQQFQEHKERIGLVVDEYGEFKGLITLEDILEEVIGDFTTQSPSRIGSYRQEEDGSWLVDGSSLLRDLNRKLNLNLPLDGPRTLNGLVLEHFEDIPEPGTSFRIGPHAIEVVQAQNRIVKSVKIFP